MELAHRETGQLPSVIRSGGDRLRSVRLRHGLSTRKVADLSRLVASEQGSEDFIVSHARLTQIENENSTPSIYKLFTLSAIYGVAINELLSFYVQLPALGTLHHSMNAAHTHVLPFEGMHSHSKTVPFPLKTDSMVRAEETNLLSRVVEAWAQVPFAFLERLNLPHHRYGWIGLSDYTMYPLIRPGTFIQIEDCHRMAQPVQYRNEYDRPVYFIELRTGYVASWCDIVRGRLVSIPHPLSPCRAREFAYPSEAEIVGRVTGLAVRLTDLVRAGSKESKGADRPIAESATGG